MIYNFKTLTAVTCMAVHVLSVLHFIISILSVGFFESNFW